MTCSDMKEVITCCNTQHISFGKWTLYMRKWRAFNASIKGP